MRWVLSLAFLGTTTLVAASPADRGKPPSKSAAPKKTTSATKQAKTAGSKSSASASAGKVRGRRSGSGRSPRVSPPSFQLHPDTERYQQIQQALTERGYFKGEANGTWGDDSVDALRRFQADQKLPNDGKITALTLTGLGLGPRHDGSTASAAPMASSPDLPASPTTPPAEPTTPPVN